MNRRRFLALLAWGAALTFLPGAAGAARPPELEIRELAFHNLHTGESLNACYWVDGAYVPAALEQVDAVLRDHRTGEIRRMEPRLIDLVFALTERLGSTSPVQVISGYRSPATNARLHGEDPAHVAARSLHLTGEAVDLCFADRPLRQVRDAALALNAGGVGYYPASGFVHIDIGKPRYW